MDRLDILNFRSIALTAFHPIMPLFVNTWTNFAYSKWLGIAAKVTYNSNFRNGWVIIDTTIKGTAGTPLLEFSCWESHESRYNIVVPRMMTYKYFFRDKNWRANFIARTSVSQSELWSSRHITYSFLLNGYSHNFFLRNTSYLYLLKSVRLMLFTANLLWDYRLFHYNSFFDLIFSRHTYFLNVRGALKNKRKRARFMKRIYALRREHLNFLLFDRFFVAGADNKNFFLNNNYNFFKNKFLKLFKNVFFRLSSPKNKTKITHFRVHADGVTLENVFFKIFLSIVIFTEMRLVAFFHIFFDLLVDSLGRDLSFIFLNRFSTFPGKLDSSDFSSMESIFTNFFSIFLRKILVISGISLVSKSKLVMGGVLQFSNSFFKTEKAELFLGVSASSLSNISFFLKSYSYKFKQLYLSNLYFFKPKLVVNYFGPNTISLKEFLRYNIRIRRTRRVAYVPRTVFNMPKYPWNRWFRARKRRLQRLRRKQNRLLDQNKRRGIRPFRYLCNWSKMALTDRRQSVFLIFWALNFFNFSGITTTRQAPRSTFYVAVRLIRFFKKFFIFFRFYSFYLNLLRVSVKSNVKFTFLGDVVTAGSFKIFLFLLGKRFRKLLVVFRLYVLYLIRKSEKYWIDRLHANTLVKFSFFDSLKFLTFSSLDRFSQLHQDVNKVNFLSRRERFISESSAFPTFLLYKYLNFIKYKNLINFNHFTTNSFILYLNFLFKTRDKFNRLLLRKFSDKVLNHPFKCNEEGEYTFSLLNFNDMVSTWKLAVNKFLVVRWHKNNFRRNLSFLKAKELFTNIILHTVEFFLPGLIIERVFKFRKILYNLFGKYLLSRRKIPLVFNTKHMNRFCTSILEYFIDEEVRSKWKPITKKWLSYVMRLFRNFVDHRKHRPLLLTKPKKNFNKFLGVSFFRSLRKLRSSTSVLTGSKFLTFFKKFAVRLNSKVLKTFFYSYLKKHKLSSVRRNQRHIHALESVSSILNSKFNQSEKVDYPNRKSLWIFNFFYRDFNFNKYVRKELVLFRYLSPSIYPWTPGSRWRSTVYARSYLSNYRFILDKLLVLNTIYPLIKKRFFTPDNDRFFWFSDLAIDSYSEADRVEEIISYYRLTSHAKVNIYARSGDFFRSRFLFGLDPLVKRMLLDLRWYMVRRHPIALLQFTFEDFFSTDFWSRKLFDSSMFSLSLDAYRTWKLPELDSVSSQFFNYLNLVGYSAQNRPHNTFVDSNQIMVEFLNYAFLIHQPSLVDMFYDAWSIIEASVTYLQDLQSRYSAYLRLYIFDNVTKIYVKFFLPNLVSFINRMTSYESRSSTFDSLSGTQRFFRYYLSTNTLQLQSFILSNFTQKLLLNKLPVTNGQLCSTFSVRGTFSSNSSDFISSFRNAAYRAFSTLFFNNSTPFFYVLFNFFKAFNTKFLGKRGLTRSSARKLYAFAGLPARYLVRPRKLRNLVTCLFSRLRSLPGGFGFRDIGILSSAYFSASRSLKSFYNATTVVNTWLGKAFPDSLMQPLSLSSVAYNSYVAGYNNKFFKLLTNRVKNLDFSYNSALFTIFKYRARLYKDIRSLPPLKLEVYARKRGLYKRPKWWEMKPKRRPTNQPEHMTDAYYRRFILGEDNSKDKKKGPRKWKPRVKNYGAGSIFSRTNMASMLLKFDFPEVRFRFVKLFYTWKIRKLKKYFVTKLFSNFTKLGLNTRRVVNLMSKIRKICFLKAKNVFLANRLERNFPKLRRTGFDFKSAQNGDSEINSRSPIIIYKDKYKFDKKKFFVRRARVRKVLPNAFKNRRDGVVRAKFLNLFSNSNGVGVISSKTRYKRLRLLVRLLRALGFSSKKILFDNRLLPIFSKLITNLRLLHKKRLGARFHLKWKDSRLVVKYFVALFSLQVYEQFSYNLKLCKVTLKIVAFFFRTWSLFLNKYKLGFSTALAYNFMFFNWLRAKIYKFFLLNTKVYNSKIDADEDLLGLSEEEALQSFNLTFDAGRFEKRRYIKFRKIFTRKMTAKRRKWVRKWRRNVSKLLKSGKGSLFKFSPQVKFRFIHNRHHGFKRRRFYNKYKKNSPRSEKNKRRFNKGVVVGKKYIWYRSRPRDFTPYYDKKGKLFFRPIKHISRNLDLSKLRLFRLKKSVLTLHRRKYPELYSRNAFRGRKFVRFLKFFFKNKKNKWFIRYVGLLKASKNRDFSRIWWIVGNRRRIKKRLANLHRLRKIKLYSKAVKRVFRGKTIWMNYSFLLRQAKNYFNFTRISFLFRKFRIKLRKDPSILAHSSLESALGKKFFLTHNPLFPGHSYQSRLLGKRVRLNAEVLNKNLEILNRHSYSLISKQLYSGLARSREALKKSKSNAKYVYWSRRKSLNWSSLINVVKHRKSMNWAWGNRFRALRVKRQLIKKFAYLRKLRKRKAWEIKGKKNWGSAWRKVKAKVFLRFRKTYKANLKAKKEKRIDALNQRWIKSLGPVRWAFLVQQAKAKKVSLKKMRKRFYSLERAHEEGRRSRFKRSVIGMRRYYHYEYHRKTDPQFLRAPFKWYHRRKAYKAQRVFYGLNRLIFKTLVSALLKLLHIYRFQRLMNVQSLLSFTTTTALLAPISLKHNSYVLYSFFIKKFFNILYDRFIRVSHINKTFFLKRSKVAFIFSFIFNFFKKFTVSYFNFSIFYRFSEDFFRGMLKVFFDKLVVFFVKDAVADGKEARFGFFKNFVILHKLFKKNLLDFSSARINYFALGKSAEIKPNFELISGHSILNSLFLIWDMRVTKIFLNNNLLQFFYDFNIMDKFTSRGYLFRSRKFRILGSVKKNRYKSALLREMAYTYPSYPRPTKVTLDGLKSIYSSLASMGKLPYAVKETAKDFPRFASYWYRLKEWRRWLYRRQKPFVAFLLLYAFRTNLHRNKVPDHVGYGTSPKYSIRSSKNWFFFYKMHESILEVR